mmetsp:Transcript_15031/g.26623  ORF Transcript_15031/g.26623 Transcript_15031/m.26623 type:complete len:97 (-) Transcript_15031:2332-2622(-)
MYEGAEKGESDSLDPRKGFEEDFRNALQTDWNLDLKKGAGEGNEGEEEDGEGDNTRGGKEDVLEEEAAVSKRDTIRATVDLDSNGRSKYESISSNS